MTKNNYGDFPQALEISGTIYGDDPSTWPAGWETDSILVLAADTLATVRREMVEPGVRKTPTGHILELVTQPLQQAEVVDLETSSEQADKEEEQ